MRLCFERCFSHYQAMQMIMSHIYTKYADLDENNKTYEQENVVQCD